MKRRWDAGGRAAGPAGANGFRPWFGPWFGPWLGPCLGLCFALALACALPAAVAQPAAAASMPALSPAQADRLQALARELRCVVCQNESLADSQAPLALDLKRELALRLAAGADDAALKAFLVERYGDFVVYRPPVAPRTWLLWGGPLLLLAAAAWLLARQWRHDDGGGGGDAGARGGAAEGRST